MRKRFNIIQQPYRRLPTMNAKLRSFIPIMIMLVVFANVGAAVYHASAATPIPPGIPKSKPISTTPAPTATTEPPTATFTVIPPTATATTEPPTATFTPVPPTPIPPTDTPVPPTATLVTATGTPTEVTATPTSTVTNTPTATPTEVTPTLTPTAAVVRTDSLILSYPAGASDADIAALVAGVNGVEVKRVPQINRILVRVPHELAKPAAARAALTKGKMSAQAANSTIIELNGTFHAFFTPNDPLFSTQQQMPAIFASAAWDISPARCNGVIFALVDSGVNAAHPALVATVLSGYDFVNVLTTPTDVYGHDTHVPRIIAAKQNNLNG